MSHASRFRSITVLGMVLLFAIAGCSAQPEHPTSPSGVAPSGMLAGIAPPPGHVDPNPRQVNRETFEVCKDYVGTVGPPVTITVRADIDNNGTVDQTYQIQLANGECRDVWISGEPGDLVTVTEDVPPGYTPSYVRTTLIQGITTVDPPVQGSSASALVSGNSAALVIFTNTAAPAIGTGRFTGGGFQIVVGIGRISRGLTIHCDRLLSNNLEVNWNGNQFHMTDHLTTVECSDDPNIDQKPPVAPLDTLIGVGTGRYNGQSGYTIEFTLVDAGEPGRNDKAALKIFQTSNPSNVVLDVPLVFLDGGNLQAHFDQPHK